MDKNHCAPPKKLWNDSSVNTNRQWLCMVSAWCEMDFVHPSQNPASLAEQSPHSFTIVRYTTRSPGRRDRLRYRVCRGPGSEKVDARSGRWVPGGGRQPKKKGLLLFGGGEVKLCLGDAGQQLLPESFLTFFVGFVSLWRADVPVSKLDPRRAVDSSQCSSYKTGLPSLRHLLQVRMTN